MDEVAEIVDHLLNIAASIALVALLSMPLIHRQNWLLSTHTKGVQIGTGSFKMTEPIDPSRIDRAKKGDKK